MIQHRTCDVAVIGAGAAGLAAAAECARSGLAALAVDREEFAGGILRQCIHNGFGLRYFKEELTGPEYARRVELQAKEAGAEFALGHTVSSIERREDGTFTLTTLSAADGVTRIDARAVILAMGCRERSKGALNIAGTRPAGLFSAGTAQKYVNIYGHLPGKRVVILGSGDIGLIMARRMTLEGAKVECVCEIMEHSSGLKRNIAQCLDDFGIPLYLEHTIVEIEGEERVEGVVIAQVDKTKKPIPGTEREIACDTVLFSVGLIPENELSKGAGLFLDPRTKGCFVDEERETEIPGIFACGNVLHVHDLVDFVSAESENAGKCAAEYIKGAKPCHEKLTIKCTNGVRYCVPTVLNKDEVYANQSFKMRVSNVFKKVELAVLADGVKVFGRKRPVVAPGEMENIVLTAEQMKALKQASEVEITLIK